MVMNDISNLRKSYERAELSEDALVQILTEPKNALVLQYTALLKTDGIDIVFSKEAVDEIARLAEEVNTRTENIGARRLHTLPGIVPGQFDRPAGCLLSPRCPKAQDRCHTERPGLFAQDGVMTRCFFPMTAEETA